jgi:hypothetical protein
MNSHMIMETLSVQRRQRFRVTVSKAEYISVTAKFSLAQFSVIRGICRFPRHDSPLSMSVLLTCDYDSCLLVSCRSLPNFVFFFLVVEAHKNVVNRLIE